MSFWFITYLFQFQHWPGRENLMIIELILMGVSALLVTWKFNQISKPLKSAYSILFITTIILQFGFGRYVLTSFSMNHSDFLLLNEYRVVEDKIFSKTENGGYLNAQTKLENDSLQSNLKKITNLLKDHSNSFSDDDRESNLWYISSMSTLDSVNLLIAEEGLIWVDEAIDLNPKYGYYEIKSNLLIKLERWDEAKNVTKMEKDLYTKENGDNIDSEYILEINERLDLIKERMNE